MSPRPRYLESIASTAEAEMSRRLAFEEKAALCEPDAESMRWSAAALRARARCAEDKEPPHDKMITVSVMWARVIAHMLESGADAKELFDA